jgi:hypothetical protein
MLIGCNVARIRVAKNIQQFLAIHEILRHENSAAFPHSPCQLAKDASPILRRQIVRRDRFIGEGIDRQVFHIKIVGPRGSFAEKFNSAVAKQLVDSRSEEPNNVCCRLEACNLGCIDPRASQIEIVIDAEAVGENDVLEAKRFPYVLVLLTVSALHQNPRWLTLGRLAASKQCCHTRRALKVSICRNNQFADSYAYHGRW